MNMLEPMTFLESVGKMQKCNLNMPTYYLHDYKCACGEVHNFSSSDEVLAQGAWKLILVCPDDMTYVTCVKLKSVFLGIGFKGFESLFGLKLNDEENFIFRGAIKAAIMMSRMK